MSDFVFLHILTAPLSLAVLSVPRSDSTIPNRGNLSMLLLLLLSRFSRVRLCATPQTAAHQAPRPWDSPGKNTGVGCHFLLQCMKVKSESEVAQSCLTLSDPLDCSLPGSSIHGFSRQEYWSGMPLPSPNKLFTFLQKYFFHSAH